MSLFQEIYDEIKAKTNRLHDSTRQLTLSRLTTFLLTLTGIAIVYYFFRGIPVVAAAGNVMRTNKLPIQNPYGDPRLNARAPGKPTMDECDKLEYRGTDVIDPDDNPLGTIEDLVCVRRIAPPDPARFNEAVEDAMGFIRQGRHNELGSIVQAWQRNGLFDAHRLAQELNHRMDAEGIHHHININPQPIGPTVRDNAVYDGPYRMDEIPDQDDFRFGGGQGHFGFGQWF